MIKRRGEREKGRKGDSGRILYLPFSSSPFLPFLLLFFAFLSACGELEKPHSKPYYAQINTPPAERKEFRWSNGKMPKSFDPARAAAPPETDIARAIFEGLTEIEAQTLKAIPAIAESWSSSDDSKTWTFRLRRDARWSNGEPVTAEDFIRSWTRLAGMGEKISHHRLLNNIAGMQELKPAPDFRSGENSSPEVFFQPELSSKTSPVLKLQENTNSSPPAADKELKIVIPPPPPLKIEGKPKNNKKKKPEFGVVALDEYTLEITLIKPDKEFPKLVAHPIFYPVYGEGKEFEGENLRADIITNGAFRIASVGQDGLTLDRSETYWNRKEVELERVKFVPSENAEQALEAYRLGLVDAVTNAEIEPLALKLLMPYEDFKFTTHGAINFYEFNPQNPSFKDRRVREALAIAIERERLTDGDMKGATRPALSFMPFKENQDARLAQSVKKAQNLLAAAGFAGGEDFPTIKLTVNRNDVQQRIAKSVARMWKENLNVETEIIVRENAEMDAARKSGDFDIIRRGEVLPTVDQTANLLAIFAPKKTVVKKKNAEKNPSASPEQTNPGGKTPDTANGKTSAADATNLTGEQSEMIIIEYLDEDSDAILTEEEALSELPAIPLYFPTTYSLVKPYVNGFEINTLDAPSLKDVRIDINWQPDAKDKQS